MQKFNLTEWALKRQPLVYFIIILVFIAGIFLYLNLGRMEDPDFVIRQMVISVAWPGASAEQVEQQVTDKIEKRLQDTPGLDYLQSESLPGQAYIIVSLKYALDPDKLQPTWFKVRNMVNDIKDTLPAGVVGPYYNDSFADVYGSVFTISSADYSYEEMRQAAEQVRQTLLRVPQVKKVQLIGVQPEKIYIEMNSSKLAQLGISPGSVISALQAQNAMTPSGMITTSTHNVCLRVSGMFEDLEDIRSLPLPSADGTICLGDIAKVQRSYTDPPEPKMYFNGKPAIGIGVSMEERGNILQLGKDLGAAIAKAKQELPLGMEIDQVANQPQVVKDSLNEFVVTLLIAIAVVLLVCFLSLGFRTGLVVAIGIPLVICGVFCGMYLMGIDLHRISLGALIIALGLLVDDAIIVVEMMKVKLEQGWERDNAVVFAYSSTASPRLIGALVTCCGFIPVAFSVGAATEFIGSLFWVVTMALLLSWVVAGTVTPLLGYRLIKPAAHDNPDYDLYDTRFYTMFRRILTWSLTHRKLVLSLTLIAFLASIGLMTIVKQEFFPASVRPELIVDMKLPEGSAISNTDAQARRFANLLKNDADIVNCTYYVGQSAPRFVLNALPVLPCSNYAQFVIVAKDYEARQRLRSKCEGLLTDDFPEVFPHCWVLGIGPQPIYPVAFRVSGPDKEQVKNIAFKMRSVMATQSYLKDVNLDWSQKDKIAHLEIDQDKARMLGIDSQSLKAILQAQLSGVPIAEFREENRTISLVVRLDEQSRQDLSVLKDLSVPLSNGQYVPLDQIANISYGAEEGTIWRRDNQPCISVQAEINGEITPKEATRQALEAARAIVAGLPDGYNIKIGGLEEMSREGIGFLMQPLPIMVLLILFLLMVELESLPKVVMTLAMAPLGLIGVSLALLLTHRALGFVALCGVLALAGIIIRNAVVLIDQIEQQIEAGETFWDAITHATVQRFRPIMLTAGAAILGMIPLSTSVFWGPMAIAIAGGLFIATILTLIILPVMYAAWYRVEPPTQG